MKVFISAVLLAWAAIAQAQQTVFMPIVIEVSGNGAVSAASRMRNVRVRCARPFSMKKALVASTELTR